MADRGRVGALQVGSKRCAQKVWRQNHEQHRTRVQRAKPATDVSAPATLHMDHLHNNLKKERLLEDRYVEIDRENKVLLTKMSQIMRKPDPFNNSVANERAPKGPPTLNRAYRKNELTRITTENQRLLKAIQSTQPVYSAKKWEDNYRKSEVLLRNCSAYPVITRLPRVRSEPSVLRQLGESIVGEEKDGAAPASDSDTREQKFVLKEGKQIGQVYFLIEMATDGRTLNISAYNGESQTSLELVVNEKKHRRLFRETDGDYSKIAERLRVEGSRLLLDSPAD